MTDGKDRPLVWLCSSYSSPALSATQEAVEAAANMWRGGNVDFLIPQVMSLASLMKPMTSIDWDRWRYQFIARCDAVLVRVHAAEDPNARNEITWAEDQGVPVFHSLLDLMRWWNTREPQQ